MKKGYFFTLDAFMAMAILVICVVLIFSIHSSKPYPLQSIFLSDDVMYYLSNTKIYELQSPFVASMVSNGNITMTENSLMEQAAVFYISNRSGLARVFLVNVTQNLVPKKYGFMLRVYNSSQEYVEVLNNGQSLQNESRLIITSRRILFGVINDTSWGPMTAEVRLWQ
jgi:hypothetical protein